MTTLREAAQRAMKSLEDAIKVWTEEMEFRSCVDASDEWLESYAALREALADQSEQALEMVEPVAWMLVNAYGEQDDITYEDPMGDLPEGWTCKPLYTTPPQRKPLTDDELDALAIDEDGLPNSHFEFARAIERAHGIGGKE